MSASSSAPPATPETAEVPSLLVLASAALARGWATGARPSLEGLPLEVSRVVWKEVRAVAKRASRPVQCADMYPFVRSCWRPAALDLSDAGKWLTDASLGGVGSASSLSSVRLTGCRFVGDEGMRALCALPALSTLDLSWTSVGDAGVAALGRLGGRLRSLNLTGLGALTDGAVSSLLVLSGLERLSLACTRLGDAALDYLTYYSRYRDAAPGAPSGGAPASSLGVHGLRWLELSSTSVSDVGVGKLVATIEEGTPYGRVFPDLEYLALSSTPAVSTSAVRQVRTKYALEAPLPNAQRTLAKSNSVALSAQPWVLRLDPADARAPPAVQRAYEDERLVAYVAAYTKEMDAARHVLRMLEAADRAPPPPPTQGPHGPPAHKKPRLEQHGAPPDAP